MVINQVQTGIRSLEHMFRINIVQVCFVIKNKSNNQKKKKKKKKKSCFFLFSINSVFGFCELINYNT